MPEPRPDLDLTERLAALEARLDRLERPTPVSTPPPILDPERFWALDALRRREGETPDEQPVAGRVVFAGLARAPGVGAAMWQEEHLIPALLEREWAGAAPTLAALAHPVRLEIIRRLIAGDRTTAQLSAIPGLGTSGQLYHHLRELQGAGLVVQQRRNDYAVATDRAVQCLILIAAAQSPARVQGQATQPEETPGAKVS
ncbi:MAG: ArsR/SmtB family transcription factor [Candidatus Dormibacteraceae bacterium]